VIVDPIADMLTRIRNANQRKKEKVDVPASRIKEEIVKRLKEEGFISNYKRIPDHKQGILRIYLKYAPGGESVIRGIQRVSKPGLKIYSPAEDIPRIQGGMGIVIISTPRGVLIDREARRNRVGGEVLCKVW